MDDENLILPFAAAYLALAAAGYFLTWSISRATAERPSGPVRKAFWVLSLAGIIGLLAALIWPETREDTLHSAHPIHFIVLLVPSMLAMNLGLYAAQQVVPAGWPRWCVRIAKWLLTPMAPLLVTWLMMSVIAQRNAHLEEQNIWPLAAAVEDARRHEGAYPTTILETVRKVTVASHVTYCSSGKEFLLYITAPSMGDYGDTVYFDRDAARWRRFDKEVNRPYPEIARFDSLIRMFGWDRCKTYSREGGDPWKERMGLH